MRNGKLVNENDPIYLLDKNKGFCRIPTLTPCEWLEVQNLKFANREAYDNNYFDLKVGKKTYRVQKDDLEMALKYV